MDLDKQVREQGRRGATAFRENMTLLKLARSLDAIEKHPKARTIWMRIKDTFSTGLSNG